MRPMLHHLAAIGIQPAWNPWLLALFFLLMAATVYYLYRAQRRIASARVVAALTTIRLMLVLLLAALLFAPLMRWNHTEKSAGTLWLVLDQSPSMAVVDKQATPVERLRWADALEYLPSDARKNRFDRTAALLTCLREDLAALKSPTQNSDDKKPVARFAKVMQSWNQDLKDLSRELAQSERIKTEGQTATKAIDMATKLVDDALKQVDSRQELKAAIQDVPFDAVRNHLDAAVAALRLLADKEDAQVLTARSGERLQTQSTAFGGLAKVAEGMGRAAKLSRLDLALLDLTGKNPVAANGFMQTIPEYRVKIAAVADSAQAITAANREETADAIKRALTPAGQSTSLAAGLQLVSDQVAPEEPTSVLVVSDGRQNTGPDPAELARSLAARGVRVYGLFLGSDEVIPDAAIEQVDAPDWVYKDDTVRITALLRLDGLTGKKVNVELHKGTQLADTQSVTPQSNSTTARMDFNDKTADAGVLDYELKIVEVEGDSDTSNNVEAFHVTAKKDKLSILVIEDQPRWEYRYLVNYFNRDSRVKLQSVLAQPARIEQVTPPPATRASPANDKREAQLLPTSREEWSTFDVIVLGDVPRELLDAQAQEDIAWAVQNRGTALIVVAGQQHMPVRYQGQRLADVLPVTIANDWSEETLAEHLRTGFRARLTPDGQASILSQFLPDAQANADLWSANPLWYWHAGQTQAKPAASVLWSIADADTAKATSPEATSLSALRERALLSTMSVGLGRVLYLSSDQTWRMRQVNGLNLQDRFWGQVIRWATGSDLPAGGKFARFGADKPRYGGGEHVVVTARLLRDDLAPMREQKLEVVAKRPAENPEQARAATGEPTVVRKAQMKELDDMPGYYRADLGELPAGSIELSLRGTEVERLLDSDESATQKTLAISVQAHLSIERKNMNTDRAGLARIVAAGDGTMLDGPYADILARRIPRLYHETTSVEQAGFFGDPDNHYTRLTHWLFMAAFVTLITAEWVIRKRAGLV